jgi:hypothetical protein
MSRFFSQRGERERVSDNQKKDEKDEENTGQLLKREIFCIENVSHCD